MRRAAAQARCSERAAARARLRDIRRRPTNSSSHRTRPRSIIEQQVDARRMEVYGQCTAAARDLAKVKPTDLLPSAPAGAWSLLRRMFTKLPFF